MKDIYKIQTRPVAQQENMIQGKKYRITVLTEMLIRLEYNEEGQFEDRPTQMVYHRDFPKVDYRVVRSKDGIEIHTPKLSVYYDEKLFSKNGLSIQVKGNLSHYLSTWRYSESIQDLKGTARTLDMIDGEVELEGGILSQYGCALLDDSTTQVITEDGWIEPRISTAKDLYFWGYGHDYKLALKDFYYLCGSTPLLPRYALGNWWSRYYPYSEQTYYELLDRFDRDKLPFTVAVIDMDWHLTKVNPKYGSGWTGYTWNKELFPDPERFLETLHSRGLYTTLNVHPADGIRGYEEVYPEMARRMGVDQENEDPVVFDASNPEFIEAYFECVHHPREEEGIDFWWVDWQQGNTSKIKGLDPLWILNHYHYLDARRNGERGMLLSRYAGPGSHRYSIGFSGDTITTWESLDFQPYFTANASNVGYGWWSHDIGGHMMGYKDDEMATRWSQFGVFSPIMRLHSSASPFNGKEPWRFKPEAEKALGEALRIRHRMMPYLYTMNYRAYQEGLPICLPMYYEFPEIEEAYQVPNQYYFGSECVVVPITSARTSGLNVAKVSSWIPEGRYYDVFTGMAYNGNRKLDIYRDINSIPVLAKAGAIIPLTDEITSVEAVKNPDTLRIKVFTGANGAFTLYEDDNISHDYEIGKFVETQMTYTEDDKEGVFTIHPSKGSIELIPAKRKYSLEFIGVSEKAQEYVDEYRSVYHKSKQCLTVEVDYLSVNEELKMCFPCHTIEANNRVEERIFEFLNQAEISFEDKSKIYSVVLREESVVIVLAQLYAMDVGRELLGALTEIITALQ